MNLNDAIELLKVVSAIPVKDSTKNPKIRIFYKEGEGYTLGIKANLVNAVYRSYLGEIVKSRNLGILESKGYLLVYGYRWLVLFPVNDQTSLILFKCKVVFLNDSLQRI